MAANITYDTDAFFGDSQTAALEPEEVFRAGKSVCSGYTTGDLEIDINHDWNAVLVDRTCQ